MSATTDNVRPSARPNTWRIDNLTVAAVVLGLGNLLFCTAVLAAGQHLLGLELGPLRTLAAVTTVFSGQAVFYAVRERRRLWSSRPGRWVVLSSVVDVLLFGTLASGGVLMEPLPVRVVAGILAVAVAFAFALDALKARVFRHLKMIS